MELAAEDMAARFAAVKAIHQPRRVAGGEIRCVECADYYKYRLHRAKWPCRTVRLLGVDK